MRFTLYLCASALVLGTIGSTDALAGKKGKKKKGPTIADLEGWAKTEEMSGECFFPKNYDSLGPGDRRIARMEAMNAMLEQWRGGRGGPSVDPRIVDKIETVFLGTPELVEKTSRASADFCVKTMQGGGAAEWQAWIKTLPSTLTEGMCKGSLPGTLYDYLSLGIGWHIPAPVCKGEAMNIKISDQDYYRLSKDGEWINAAGEAGKVAPKGYPCDIETCLVGQVVLKFENYQGVATYYPVGTELRFVPPDHGEISITVNDDMRSDNEYKVEAGLQHHASVEYRPE